VMLPVWSKMSCGVVDDVSETLRERDESGE
jgi:hypothetical protein